MLPSGFDDASANDPRGANSSGRKGGNDTAQRRDRTRTGHHRRSRSGSVRRVGRATDRIAIEVRAVHGAACPKAGNKLLVNIERPFDNNRLVEGPHDSFSRSHTQLSCKVIVLGKPPDSVGEPRRGPRRNEQSVLAVGNDIFAARNVGRDERQATGARLDQASREAFAIARKHEDIGLGEKPAHVLDMARKLRESQTSPFTYLLNGNRRWIARVRRSGSDKVKPAVAQN